MGKPRELTHDTKVYRAYQRAEERQGGRVRRVVLDYELKRDYQRFLHERIRIDAKRQALDALDNLRRGGDGANGNGKPASDAEIETIVEVADDLTSQSRHSLLLQGSPPSGKLLIPLNRRDVRVVEGARLESVCRGNSTEGSNPSLSASLRSRALRRNVSFGSAS